MSSPTASDASHESDDEQHDGTASKAHATKDKECPYCKIKFTSSSLGRHLDQFISKKRPDGVHDVAEIRRLRAGITRRSARGSKKRGKSSGPDEHHEESTPTSEGRPSNMTVNAPASIDSAQRQASDMRFNKPTWHATGVITDNTSTALASTLTAPSPTQISHVAPAPSSVVGVKRPFSTFAADNNPSTLADTARALELSLREVLDTVRAATKRTAPAPTPFSFDIKAQTFPSLCLALLPTPATLFKPAPFATPSTIPLTSPGAEQHHALQLKIPEIIDAWKWTALSHAQRSQTLSSTNIGEEAELLSRTAQNYIQEALVHLDMAFHQYVTRPPEEQLRLWQIELLRAFKIEQDKAAALTDRLEKMVQETSQLQQQIDYISRCQWPREMALWPPDRVSFDQSMQQELRANMFQEPGLANTNGAMATDPDSILRGSDRWDFDRLLNKWKRHVREDRARRSGQPNIQPTQLGDSNLAEPSHRTVTPTSLATRKPDANGTHSGTHTATNSPPAVMPSANARSDTLNSVSGMKSSAGTPITNNLDSVVRAAHPTQPTGNVQIVSDVDDQMARFMPWLKQQSLLEREQRRRDLAFDNGQMGEG